MKIQKSNFIRLIRGLNPYSTENEVVAATKSFELKINEL